MGGILKALAILSLLLPLAAAADGVPASPYIQVNGHGELQVAPDMAYLSLTLEKSDKDVKLARDDVEARAAKVIALARKLGLADADIDAPAVTVMPEYQWLRDSPNSSNTRKLVGQHVTRAITLTLRDLGRYGELVDGLFDAGVTDLGNVTLDRSDRRALEQKASALAMQDAQDKAAGLAKSAGVTLGALFSITAQGGSFEPRPMMAAAARAPGPAPEYLNGKIEISADVLVYYLIGK